MSRRGMHPSLMKCNQPEDQQRKAENQELSGYESAQRKRFLRSEQQDSTGEKEQVA